MMYSVWNPVAGIYDYYQTPASANELEVPDARHLSSSKGTKLGLSSEQAGWPLPLGAKRVGSGKFAKGMIARKGFGLGLGDDAPKGNPVWGILAGIGVLAWIVFGKSVKV